MRGASHDPADPGGGVVHPDSSLPLFCGTAPRPSAGSAGENRYKGLFSLLVFVAIGCILAGWRSASPMPSIFCLSGAHPGDGDHADRPCPAVCGAGANHFRRWLVHPQLLGVLLWSGAHLAVNSEARSLVLFGGLGLWALISIVWISMREWGRHPVPPPPGRGRGSVWVRGWPSRLCLSSGDTAG